MTFGKRTGALLAAALLAAATGCSTKANNNAGGQSSGGASSGASGGTSAVKTGRGVNGTQISLGVLTDLTGVFAALGTDVTNANSLYWNQQNSGKKVCGKYTVDLNVKDHGYNVQQAVQLFSGMKDSVLAMQQTLGSPINTALADQYTAGNYVNLPSAWARNLTEPPGNGVVGATYDLEMVNVLGFAMQKGLIKKGDKLGHIYFEGEYGANGLAGSKEFAKQNGMTVVEAKIKSTDQDMTPYITSFKSQGVNAVLLTVAPGQTGSAASVMGSQGLNVPLIGNNPVFAPGLLKGPSGGFLKQHLLVASPVNSFDNQQQLLNDYKAKYNNANPSLGVVFGYGMADVMRQILDKACENGDLTPEGVLAAKKSLSNIDTGNLVVPINFSVPPGSSPSRQSYILQPADVPGGAKAISNGTVTAPDTYTSALK